MLHGSKTGLTSVRVRGSLVGVEVTMGKPQKLKRAKAPGKHARRRLKAPRPTRVSVHHAPAVSDESRETIDPAVQPYFTLPDTSMRMLAAKFKADPSKGGEDSFEYWKASAARVAVADDHGSRWFTNANYMRDYFLTPWVNESTSTIGRIASCCLRSAFMPWKLPMLSLPVRFKLPTNWRWLSALG